MITDRDPLKAAYDAFNARDINAILTLLHAEVDWPNGWEGGRVYGPRRGSGLLDAPMEGS